ncbi:glycosyltransferase [Candidatus Saccharibacteria bacterium]|nr:glycosyltransferase [Candidatus Saccharibacteria bacterium]
MTILVSGGGTGGHVTPILAVAHELKKLQPDCRIIYIGERGGKFAELTHNHAAIDHIYTIYAGKLRRYHGESWLRRLVDIKTLLFNVRDAFFVVIGIFQAWRLVNRIKPDVVFLKGGYVGVPVGVVSAFKQLPFITHDSDAIPGLANRLVSRWAAMHATGLPTNFYNYPKDKAVYVGVLVSDAFKSVDTELQRQYRAELHLPADALVLLVTGGSLGALRLNTAMSQLVPELLAKYPNLYIVHQVGKGNLNAYSVEHHPRLIVLEFMVGMHRYTGAADVVVARAGANTLAELGVQGKACVVVPNPDLTGGHQLKNAEYLLEHKAVLAVDEATFKSETDELKATIEQLLDNPTERRQLGKTLQSLTKLQAAQELAQLLLSYQNSSPPHVQNQT